jgi:RNA-directed DNA polymerase
LQRRLWKAAKQQPGRRFHALYDRIYRCDVLWEAWRRVKRNRGAAGIDALTLADVEQMGVEVFLEDLSARVRAGRYRPVAVRRRYIPKGTGGQRPLGIPTVAAYCIRVQQRFGLAADHPSLPSARRRTSRHSLRTNV